MATASVNPRNIAMGKLAAFFPLGASKDRTEMYLEHRWMTKVETRDLAEAVERLSVTRAEKSFPTLAVLLRTCLESSNDRRNADAANANADAKQNERRMTEADFEDCRKIRALGRIGVFFCDVCRDFIQAAKGDPGGWKSCHYAQNVAMWAAHTDKPVTREAILRAWDRFDVSVEVKRAPPKRADGFSTLGDSIAEVPF